MNNEQLIVIGKKSKKNINAILFCFIFLLISLIIMISIMIISHGQDNANLIARSLIIIGFFAGAVWFLKEFLFYRVLPDILIWKSENSVIINNRSGKIEIPLSEISEVIQNNKYARNWISSSYGRIIIRTYSMGEYMVDGLENVDDVKTSILMHLPRRNN